MPVALGIAPFCAKRNTPLDGAGFAGIAVVEKRLERLKRGLRGRADVRSTSAKWAWVEYVLAQGGPDEGLAVLEAVRDGGNFAAYKGASRSSTCASARGSRGARSPSRRSERDLAPPSFDLKRAIVSGSARYVTTMPLSS